MGRKLFKFTLPAAVVLALVLAFTTYDRDRRFEMFITDLETVSDEVVRMISDNPTPAGVAEARRILNAKKEGLKTTLAEMKALTAGGEKLSRVEDCLKRTPAKISAAFIQELGRRKQELDRMQNAKRSVDKRALENARKENEQFVKEMELLLDDYESIIY